MALKIKVTEPGNPEFLFVDFSIRLQHSGQDIRYYANQGYAPDPSHSELLKALMKHLFTDDSGVHVIAVKPFRLVIERSLAISADDLKARVFAAARSVQKTPIEA